MKRVVVLLISALSLAAGAVAHAANVLDGALLEPLASALGGAVLSADRLRKRLL